MSIFNDSAIKKYGEQRYGEDEYPIYHTAYRAILREGAKFQFDLLTSQLEALRKENEELKDKIESKEYTLQNTFNQWQKAMSDREQVQSKLSQAIKALENASDVIHSEFCDEKHHNFCVSVMEDLAKLRGGV